jgi:hypothetical protein
LRNFCREIQVEAEFGAEKSAPIGKKEQAPFQYRL